jgi:hypothetical protein
MRFEDQLNKDPNLRWETLFSYRNIKCQDIYGRKPGSTNYFQVATVKSGQFTSTSLTELKAVAPCSWSSRWRLTSVGRM